MIAQIVADDWILEAVKSDCLIVTDKDHKAFFKKSSLSILSFSKS